MGEWIEMKFSELVEINPLISLSRAKEHFYIEMQDMDPARRYVYPQRKRPLQGGSRFVEGDTLFARISPCTEKGNINQAAGLEGEPGYGSTEFLVFRAKPGVSHKDFVLYFSKWNEIKDYAANNLQGTSGRQRVAKEAFDELEVVVPEPDEQRAIASVLSSLDAKIDLLHRQNKTLEAMAETLFRQWFVEEAEEEAAEGTLADVAVNIRDGVPVNAFNADDRYVALEHIDRRRIALQQYGSSANVASNKYRFQANDILFGKLRPYFHKVCLTSFAGICSTDILVIRPKRPALLYYCLFAFFQDEVVEYANAGSGGTRMPRTSWSDLSKYPIALPDNEKLEAFNKVVRPMMEKLQANIPQIRSLTALRDTLLPKLMSGEVRVEETILQ
jgi:type I restriction enzyme S subunit